MSADNWTMCPKCKERIDAENEAKSLAPAKLYGKVDFDVYSKAIEAAKNLVKQSETLREDYEIGIFNGKFSVSYGARCTDCDFEFSYNYELPYAQLQQSNPNRKSHSRS